MESLSATAGEQAPPRDPTRVARAASLLVRLVRSLPKDLWMRSMLEPLALELLDALYEGWAAPPSLGELSEEECGEEAFRRLVPFFALVAGCDAKAKSAVERAQVAEKAMQEIGRGGRAVLLGIFRTCGHAVDTWDLGVLVTRRAARAARSLLVVGRFNGCHFADADRLQA